MKENFISFCDHTLLSNKDEEKVKHKSKNIKKNMIKNLDHPLFIHFTFDMLYYVVYAVGYVYVCYCVNLALAAQCNRMRIKKIRSRSIRVF